MTKANKKSEPIEEEMKEEEDVMPLAQEPEVVEPEAKESKSAKKESKKDAPEAIFLAPYGRTLPPTSGKFVEIVGIHAVFETEDGTRYAVPFNQQAHGELKAGDEFIF